MVCRLMLSVRLIPMNEYGFGAGTRPDASGSPRQNAWPALDKLEQVGSSLREQRVGATVIQDVPVLV